MSFYREKRHPWLIHHEPHLKNIESGEELIARIQAKYPKGHSSLAWVIDLDSTLFCTGPRNKEIFRSYLDYLKTQQEVPALWYEALDKINPLKQSFSIRESLEWALVEHGVDSEMAKNESNEIWKAFQLYWEHHFFSSEFMFHDLPYPGSVEFVNKIWNQGFQVVYLTGRDIARSLEGTRASLSGHKFPVGDRTELILKPRFRWSMEDAEFKEEASQDISRRYEVVCSIDNEPENLHVFAKYFPKAEIVLFHSIMSQRVPETSLLDLMGNRELLVLQNFH